MRGGGGDVRVVRDVEIDDIADGGSRVVMVMVWMPIDGLGALGWVADGDVEEMALAICGVFLEEKKEHHWMWLQVLMTVGRQVVPR